MSYRDFYLQARDIADKIRSGEYQQVRQQKQKSQGIVERPNIKKPQIDTEPDEFANTLFKIMAAFQEPVLPSEERPVVRGRDGVKVQRSTEVSARPSRRGLPSGRSVSSEYAVPRDRMEAIIAEEAALRGIDPDIALRIFYHEGAGAYQSQIKRGGKGSLGGLEASFGPYQLFTGGGLGNEYEQVTGRTLTEDNTEEGIITQIRFALDKAAEQGWTPWYGRGPAGVGEREGLSNARPIGNWRS